MTLIFFYNQMKTEATENECDISLTQHSNPTENFFKFSLCFMFLRHSQTLAMDVTAILFFKIPGMQLHYDPMFDSLYIVGSCRFIFTFFVIETLRFHYFTSRLTLLFHILPSLCMWHTPHLLHHRQHQQHL